MKTRTSILSLTVVPRHVLLVPYALVSSVVLLLIALALLLGSNRSLAAQRDYAEQQLLACWNGSVKSGQYWQTEDGYELACLEVIRNKITKKAAK